MYNLTRMGHNAYDSCHPKSQLAAIPQAFVRQPLSARDCAINCKEYVSSLYIEGTY